MSPLKVVFAVTILAFFSLATFAQIDDICGEFGHMAMLDSQRLTTPYIYGKIRLSGVAEGVKLPKVTVVYSNRAQSPERITVGRTGNYCFRIRGNGDGTLIVDVDGVEVARRGVASFAAAQQREDFDVVMGPAKASASGGVGSKFARPANPKTVELYKKAAESEKAKDVPSAIGHLKAIVTADPEDFFAWGLLASLQLDRKEYADAEASLRKAIELRADYTPAWITAGRVRLAQKQNEAAIEIFKHAAELEPNNARVFQLLGETYLLTKQGSLGSDALQRAIELDPMGMAVLHLHLAHLYQLAKANKEAAKEYKAFLAKFPNHPDKAKYEKFIKENPPE
ncbi:hypothetical protein BH24ACI3_BH24ACI3_09400 [soil metagenome]